MNKVAFKFCLLSSISLSCSYILRRLLHKVDRPKAQPQFVKYKVIVQMMSEVGIVMLKDVTVSVTSENGIKM